jgi:hypothetical protein
MTSFRKINSPVALATCGMFLVPEPFGACLLLAAAIWWLWRKAGCPYRGTLSSFRERVRQVLRLPGAHPPGSVFGEKQPTSNIARNALGDRPGRREGGIQSLLFWHKNSAHDPGYPYACLLYRRRRLRHRAEGCLDESGRPPSGPSPA